MTWCVYADHRQPLQIELQDATSLAGKNLTGAFSRTAQPQVGGKLRRWSGGAQAIRPRRCWGYIAALDIPMVSGFKLWLMLSPHTASGPASPT